MPGGPGMPPGGPGGPPAKSKRSTAGIVIAAVLVLGAAAGAYLTLGGSDDGDGGGQPLGVDPDTPGGLVWEVQDGDPDNERVRGVYLLDDSLVRAAQNTLTSYSLADGAVDWTVELEGEHLCVPGTAAEDGRLVVGHGENNCAQNITMVDLNSGTKGWSRRLEPQEWPLDFEIAISGGSYAIHTMGGWNLHRIDDGEVIQAARSAYDAREQAIRDVPYGEEPFDLAEGKEICAADAVAGGEILLRRLTCATVVNVAGGSVSEPVFKLQQIDPDDGEVVWSLELPEGKWLDKVHSVDPLVVSFRDEQFEAMTELVTITEGQITAQFPVENTGVAEGDRHLIRDRWCRDGIVAYSPVADCGGVVVHDGTLFVSPPSRNNPVTALDMATGERRWVHETEEFVGQQVLAADDAGVVVFQRGYTDEPGQVVRIPLDGGPAEPLFRLDAETVVYEDFFTFFHDERLYVVPPDYSLPRDVSAYGADGTTEAPAEDAGEAGDGEDADGSEG